VGNPSIPWRQFRKLFESHGATFSQAKKPTHWKVIGPNGVHQVIALSKGAKEVKHVYMRELRRDFELDSMDDALFFSPIKKAKGR